MVALKQVETGLSLHTVIANELVQNSIAKLKDWMTFIKDTCKLNKMCKSYYSETPHSGHPSNLDTWYCHKYIQMCIKSTPEIRKPLKSGHLLWSQWCLE